MASAAAFVTGRVSKINYFHPEGKCTIGRMEVKEKGLGELDESDPELASAVRSLRSVVSFKLFGPLSMGAEVKLVGKWEADPKWGPQFIAQNAIREIPLTEAGMIRYLAECDDFKGLGPSKAALLVARYFPEDAAAPSFDDAIRSATAEEISKAARITIEAAEAFRKAWARRASVNAIASQLFELELTAHQTERIVDAFGDAALDVLKANPYALIGAVEGFGFATIDKIALRVGIAKDDPRRLRAALAFVLLSEASEGHTWIARGGLIASANKLLILDRPDARELIEGIATEEIETGKIYGDTADRVALPELFAAEARIGRTLGELGGADNLAFEGVELDGLAEIFDGLNEDQREAVATALRRRALVITGGAGTGKTTIVARIIAAYEAVGRGSVALCAPTGKAAKRLSEVTGRECSTLHRLMGFNGSKFLVPMIEASAVIVDEFSMVDVPLFAALCQRLRAGTSIVLVGDADQLPPVGPGNVLRDAINRRILPVARLSKVVRQAGALRRNSLAILDGRIEPQAEEENGVKPWILCNKMGTAEETQTYIAELYRHHLHRLGFDLTYEVQLLTAQREGPLGVVELNKVLQAVHQEKRGVVVPQLPEGRRAWLPGDKVIQTRNDYDLNIFNGDAGIVRSVSFKPGKEGDQTAIESVAVAFGAKGEKDGSLIEIPRNKLSDLSHAFALTVHKAQGSEYPCVLLVAHKAHAFMHGNHGRNWAYTGATRARNTLILVGDSWGMRNSVAHISKERRRTWLSMWAPRPELIEAEASE